MKLVIDINPFGALRLFLALLFLWAGLSKLADPMEFFVQIDAYRTGLPPEVLKLAAVTLPWLEILLGLALLTRTWMVTSSFLVAGMLAFFVGLTGMAVARGLDIKCGCFNWAVLGLDPQSSMVPWLESTGFAFFRNLLLLALAAWLCREVVRREPPETTLRVPQTA